MLRKRGRKRRKGKADSLNWFQQLRNLLMVWKIDEILDLENRTSLKLTTMSMKEIKTILDRIEGDSVSNDIERMRNIIFFSKYRLTKTHIEKLI